MDNQLELVAKSYDKGIDLGKQGIDSYENILTPYFAVEKKEIVGPMIQYFCKRTAQ